MKKIKVTLSIGVLMATMAVIGMSSSQVAAAEAAGVCNCVIESGQHGTFRDGDCVIHNCWYEID